MISNNVVYFDKSGLLAHDGLNVRHFAEGADLKAGEYFEMLLGLLNEKPDVDGALHKFLKLNGDIVAYRRINDTAAVIRSMGCETLAVKLYSLLGAYENGNWRLASVHAEGLVTSYEKFISQIQATKRFEREENAPDMSVSLKKYLGLQAENVNENTDENIGENTDENTEKNTEKNIGENTGESTEKTTEINTAGRTAGHTAGRSAGRMADKMAGRAAGRTVDKTADKTVGSTAGSAAGLAADKTVGRTSGQAMEHTSGQVAERTSERTEKNGGPQKKIILAVDDSPVVLNSVSSVLSGEYKVYTLPKPTQLEKVLKKLKPDLFLLDYQMPDINGFELIPIIRGYEEHKKTPIIFLTSLGTMDNLTTAISLGASDFTVKPFKPEILREKIAKHISADS